MYYDLMLTGDVIAALAMPALLLFVILYGSRSNWRSNAVGRSLMYAVASLAATLLLAVGTRLLTPFIGSQWDARPIIRIVMYSAVTFSAWRLFVMLLAIQRGDRDQDRADLEDRRP